MKINETKKILQKRIEKLIKQYSALKDYKILIDQLLIEKIFMINLFLMLFFLKREPFSMLI